MREWNDTTKAAPTDRTHHLLLVCEAKAIARSYQHDILGSSLGCNLGKIKLCI